MISLTRVALFAAPLLAGCGLSDTPLMVGQLESDRVEVAAEYSEAIIRRPAVEGRVVARGELLFEQNSDRIEAQMREGAAVLAQRMARLNELVRGPRKELILAAQANVDGATRDLEFRQVQLTRAQSLLDKELAPPSTRDQAKAALDAAEANLDFAHAQIAELLTGTTIEELQQARAAVQQAEASLVRMRVEQRKLNSRAPVSGIVDSLLFEVGERPLVGQPMAILLTGRQPHASIFVPESIRIAVVPGTQLTVHVDGLDTPFIGKVRWIASDAAFTPYYALTEHDRGRLTYHAKVDLLVSEDVGRLPDGIPVQIDFPNID